ncbi:flagellar hook-length control protein FliK [Roseivivax sp. GX 12232]|uniref:flagellar hook-length control protein FliK n=1 Tax=Roseivivax sp. GX 12232 TaxID=2900547 RepID=UPI001E54E246|nr:flagellar hook-length control protein FliK [Roseivivax sp. GX 12232]MCE0503898.1 flagellar hook-length control protein FliK [Roseivivax sp. GX 12232]
MDLARILSQLPAGQEARPGRPGASAAGDAPGFARVLGGLEGGEERPAQGQGAAAGEATSGQELPEGLLLKLDAAFARLAEALPAETPLSPAGQARLDARVMEELSAVFAEAGAELPQGLAEALDALAPDLPAKAPERLGAVLTALSEALGLGAPGATPDTAPKAQPAGLAETPGAPVAANLSAPPNVPQSPAQPSPEPRAPLAGLETARITATPAQSAGQATPAEALFGSPKGPQVPSNSAIPAATPGPILTTEAPAPLRFETPVPVLPVTSAPQAAALPPMPSAAPEMAMAPAVEMPRGVLDQIRRAGITEGRTRIELSPASLGALEVELATDEAGQLRVVIRAENPATLAALRGDRQGLEAMLAESGVELSGESLDFEGFEDREEASPEAPGASARTVTETSETPPETPETRPAPGPRTDGRLDILT